MHLVTRVFAHIEEGGWKGGLWANRAHPEFWTLNFTYLVLMQALLPCCLQVLETAISAQQSWLFATYRVS